MAIDNQGGPQAADARPGSLLDEDNKSAGPGHQIGGIGGASAVGGGLGAGDSLGNAAGTGVVGGAATGEGVNDIGPGSGDLGTAADLDIEKDDAREPAPGPGASNERA